MNDKKSKLNIAKIIIAIICIIFLVSFVQKGIKVLKNISQICVVENGSLRYEESVDGYILRDEIVLQGENSKNGMVRH